MQSGLAFKCDINNRIPILSDTLCVSYLFYCAIEHFIYLFFKQKIKYLYLPGISLMGLYFFHHF